MSKSPSIHPRHPWGHCDPPRGVRHHPIAQWFRRTLVRLEVAALLIGVFAVLLCIGSFFPQQPLYIRADPERLLHWEAIAQRRYGPWWNLLNETGVFHFFSTPLFWTIVVLLALLTGLCAGFRWLYVVRRVFQTPVRVSETAFTTAPYTAELQFTRMCDGVIECVREQLRERGFAVRIDNAGGGVYMRGDRNRRAQLATLVTHLAPPLLLVSLLVSSYFGWRDEVMVDLGGSAVITAPLAGCLAPCIITLQAEGFDVLHYTDGSVLDYRARLTLSRDDELLCRGIASVNHPFYCRGVAFHLQAYRTRASREQLILQVVRDPGATLAIIAAFLLFGGLTVSLTFPPAWIHVRVGQDGRILLAGRASRRAWSFARDFATLRDALELMLRGQACSSP